MCVHAYTFRKWVSKRVDCSSFAEENDYTKLDVQREDGIKSVVGVFQETEQKGLVYLEE